MYQFPNQQLYHHNHYQPCQLHNIEDTIKQNINTIPEPLFHHVTQNVTCSENLQTVINSKESELLDTTNNQKKKKKISKKLKVQTKQGEDTKEKKEKSSCKTSVDTSTFTIEERLVAGVWVHERTHTNTTISEIKNNFRKRFSREPPSKTTLLTWERKLFSTGNVCDAPRTGRPVNRKHRVSEVAASLRAAPALSLRARALQLQLPRSTLHHILRHDLPHLPHLPDLPHLPHCRTNTPTTTPNLTV